MKTQIKPYLKTYLVKGFKRGVVFGMITFEIFYLLFVYPLARSSVPFFGGKLYGASIWEIVAELLRVAWYGAVFGSIVGLVLAVILFLVYNRNPK